MHIAGKMCQGSVVTSYTVLVNQICYARTNQCELRRINTLKALRPMHLVRICGECCVAMRINITSMVVWRSTISFGVSRRVPDVTLSEIAGSGKFARLYTIGAYFDPNFSPYPATYLCTEMLLRYMRQFFLCLTHDSLKLGRLNIPDPFAASHASQRPAQHVLPLILVL